MVFLEPEPTPYDLRWRMFGIPVRVHPMFWLLSVVLGWGAARDGLHFLAIWVGCVFVSILIHELGHVVMGMVFGARGHIVLYSFGGLAIGSNRLASRRQRILVSFAGPLAGFLFLALVLGLLWLRHPDSLAAYVEIVKHQLGLPQDREDFVEAHRVLILVVGVSSAEYFLVHSLIFINLLWGLLNLLPIWPLDGGQISRDVCDGVAPGNGLRFSLGLSFVTAGLLALHSILDHFDRPLLPIKMGSMYSALLFGLLAFQSFQLLQQANAERRWVDDHWHYRDRD